MPCISCSNTSSQVSSLTSLPFIILSSFSGRVVENRGDQYYSTINVRKLRAFWHCQECLKAVTTTTSDIIHTFKTSTGFKILIGNIDNRDQWEFVNHFFFLEGWKSPRVDDKTVFPWTPNIHLINNHISMDIKKAKQTVLFSLL